MLETPVLFLVFNRPEVTARVFDRIRREKPRRLYVAGDGPRKERVGEFEKCKIVRTIATNVDWDCQVKTLFRDENLGCGKAVSSAIDWFFDDVAEGIVLEDDCLPGESFFSFCEEMLKFYRSNQEIMHICGSNFQNGVVRGDGSYYFSRLSLIWGWATWKDRWKMYDFSLRRYSDYPVKLLNKEVSHLLRLVRNGRVDTWDLQWFLSVWFNEGITITPNVNLIRNIGYGSDATHTKRVPRWFKEMCYGEILEIKHPSVNDVDLMADNFMFKNQLKYSFVVENLKRAYRYCQQLIA